MLKFVIASLLMCVGANADAQLPSFIKKCSATDPNMNKCILDQSKNVIEKLANGVKDLNIPSMDPFHIPEIIIEATKSLNVKLTDCEITGLKEAEFTKLDLDMKKLYTEMAIFIPKVTINTIYDIDGHILILPIKGHGPAEIAFHNATFEFSFGWGVSKGKDGKNYAKILNPTLKYKTDRVFYHLENLFNGEKTLGDEMNAFINENWVEFSKSIEPAISRTINDVVYGIINTFSKTIPYDIVFLP